MIQVPWDGHYLEISMLVFLLHLLHVQEFLPILNQIRYSKVSWFWSRLFITYVVAVLWFWIPALKHKYDIIRCLKSRINIFFPLLCVSRSEFRTIINENLYKKIAFTIYNNFCWSKFHREIITLKYSI